MKFNKLYNLLFEALSLDYTYSLPKNKKQQLFDFYIFQLIETYWNMHEGKDYDSGNAIDITDQIRATKPILINSLKKELLDAVYWSIACELRHITQKQEENEKIASNVKVNPDIEGDTETLEDRKSVV